MTISFEKTHLVMGGPVLSVNDHERHYISAIQLCRLYGINPRNALLCDTGDPYDCLATMGVSRERLDSLPRVYPSHSGAHYALGS